MATPVPTPNASTLSDAPPSSSATTTPSRFIYLGIPQTVGRTVHVFASRWQVFGKLAAAAVVPQMILMAGLTAVMAAIFKDLIEKFDADEAAADPVAMVEDILTIVTSRFSVVLSLAVTSLITNLVLTIVAHGAMVRATAELYVDRNPPAMHCLHQGLRQFSTLLGAGLLLRVVLGMILVLPLGFVVADRMVWLGFLGLFLAPWIVLYMAIRLSLLYPVIVTEQRTSVMEAFQRSWQLTRGAYWQIVCSGLGFVLLLGIFCYALQLVFLGMHLGGSSVLPAVISQQVPNFIFVPLFAM